VLYCIYTLQSQDPSVDVLRMCKLQWHNFKLHFMFNSYSKTMMIPAQIKDRGTQYKFKQNWLNLETGQYMRSLNWLIVFGIDRRRLNS